MKYQKEVSTGNSAGRIRRRIFPRLGAKGTLLLGVRAYRGNYERYIAATCGMAFCRWSFAG